MPDPFSNARPYFDVTFPSSGDGFSIAGFRNALAGLGFMDMIPLQPRAHNPANTSIMVRGRDASGFYNPVYYGDANQRIPFQSGDTPTISAPASNPRIDIVYMTPSGDLRVQQGSEAISPSLPSLSPSGDSRFPICAIYNKVGQTKIVNFEDRNSNTGDGYIYQDLRPWLRTAGAGATGLTSSAPVSPTGDNLVGTGSSAARHDHRHQGIHTIHAVGSGDLYGDIELGGPKIEQEGNRDKIGGLVGYSHFQTANRITGSLTTPSDDTPPLITEGNEFLALIHAPKKIGNLLEITVSLNYFEPTNSGNNCTIALYANNTLIKAVNDSLESALTKPLPLCFTAIMSVANLNAIRFSVRVGNDAGDVGINGFGAGNLFGGEALTSCLTIKEISL